MKGALIGCGCIGRKHLEAYNTVSELELVAIVDNDLNSIKNLQKVKENIRLYHSTEKLFAHESLDFIDICTPPASHYQYIMMGLNNNCHIICEKPLVTNTQELVDIYKYSIKNNKIIYPCHNYKFVPTLTKAKGIVSDKNFGKVLKAHFRVCRSGHALGSKNWQPDWRVDSSISGGGIIQDHGVHNIYIASSILGKYPSTIECIMGNLSNNILDIEDTALLTLQYLDNTTTVIDLTWAAYERFSYYEFIGENQTLMINGHDLTLTNSDISLEKKEIITGFNNKFVADSRWFKNMLLDFYETTLNKQKKLAIHHEAIVTTQTISKAYESAQLRTRVPIAYQEIFNRIGFST